MAYKRWYDTDSKLSTVVRAMEFMNPAGQRRFAEKLLELSEELLAAQGGTAYIEQLDEKKKEGLNKSNAKKRWYDQYETLHRAFNNLYALDSSSRRDIAHRLVTPIEIVKGYEAHCKRQNIEPDLCIMEEVLRSCFMEGVERTKKLYAIYLDDFQKEVEEANAKRLQPIKKPSLWATLLESIQSSLNPT